jgi:hypothetical protein
MDNLRVSGIGIVECGHEYFVELWTEFILPMISPTALFASYPSLWPSRSKFFESDGAQNITCSPFMASSVVTLAIAGSMNEAGQG